MDGTTTYDLRCPTCTAHVAAGAQWCTLCYTDLRPKPAADPVIAAAPPALVEEPALVERPESAPAAGRRGRHAKPAADELEVERVAEQMLAQLAASESGVQLGRFSGLVDSSGKKVALMAGGAVVAMTLIFVLMAAAGALL